MATTVPDSIFYPQGEDQLSPLQTVFSTLAASVQTAFAKRQGYNYRWTTVTMRNNQTGMRAGDRGYQLDTGVEYLYDGTAWQRVDGDTGWVDMFASGITGYTASSGGQVGYRKLGNVVYLRGRVSRTGGSNNMFQLPGGFRPGNAINIWQSVGSGNATQRLQVANTGVITWVDGGTFSDMSLSPVSFIAEG